MQTADEILIPLLAVGLAEMGDKTQLSVLLLSSRTREYLQLLIGVMLAFLLVDGFAILIGSQVTNIIPIPLVKFISAALFLYFGWNTLKGNGEQEEGECDLSPENALLTGFSMIFLSEWGDKTQIASALFAAEYNPWRVFVGVMTALFILSIMAVYLGRFLAHRIDRRLISRIAGAAFVLIGISLLLSAASSVFAEFF